MKYTTARRQAGAEHILLASDLPGNAYVAFMKAAACSRKMVL